MWNFEFPQHFWVDFWHVHANSCGFFLGLLSILLFLHADKTIRTHLFWSSIHFPPALWKAESNESWISFFVHFANPKCSQGSSINTNFKSILEDLAMPPLFLKQGLSCVGSAGLGVGPADLWWLFPPQQFCNFPHTFWVLYLFCCYFNRNNKKLSWRFLCQSPLDGLWGARPASGFYLGYQDSFGAKLWFSGFAW